MRTEYITLADHVEIIANKAYIMAGGWDMLTINQPLPVQHQCGIAAAFVAPWAETNETHPVEIQVIDPDGRSIAKIEGQLEVGRPAGIGYGHEQRVHMGINVRLPIGMLGAHMVMARVDGTEASIRFVVVAGPGMPPADDIASFGSN